MEYFIGEETKTTKENRIYVDIMIIDNNGSSNGKKEAIAIELKYKTQKVVSNDSKIKKGFKLNDEIYNLKEQGAKDWGSYYIFLGI